MSTVPGTAVKPVERRHIGGRHGSHAGCRRECLATHPPHLGPVDPAGEQFIEHRAAAGALLGQAGDHDEDAVVRHCVGGLVPA